MFYRNCELEAYIFVYTYMVYRRERIKRLSIISHDIARESISSEFGPNLLVLISKQVMRPI